MEEKWKKIPGSNGFSISNLGNIKKGEHQFVNIQEDMEGYYRCSVGGTRKRDRIHRFVAECFVENDDPKNKKYVNHIDGNKHNNRADNLEWCTAKHNSQHAAKTGLCGANHGIVPCIGIKIDEMDTVRLFRSEAEAIKYINPDKEAEISKVLHGKRYTTYGWLFRKLSQDSLKNIKEVIDDIYKVDDESSKSED